jgi:hypothetical protein
MWSEKGEYFGRGSELPMTFADVPTPDECMKKTHDALTVAVACMPERSEAPPPPANEAQRTEPNRSACASAPKKSSASKPLPTSTDSKPSPTTSAPAASPDPVDTPRDAAGITCARISFRSLFVP